MIDGFEFLHPQLVLDETRVQANQGIFDKLAWRVANARLPMLPLEALAGTNIVETQESIFKGYLAQTLIALEIALRRVERTIIEVMILHRIKAHLDLDLEPERTPKKAAAVAGCMIQQRLTHLLLDLAPSQAQKLFHLGRLPNMVGKRWKWELLGAAAVVRCILAFDAFEAVTIRLPTLHEDIDYGVDILVDTPLGNLAVSVKSHGGKTHTLAEVVWEETPEKDDMDVVQRNVIFRGAKEIEMWHRRRYLAARIVVARRGADDFSFSEQKADIDVIDALLTRIEEVREQQRKRDRSQKKA